MPGSDYKRRWERRNRRKGKCRCGGDLTIGRQCDRCREADRGRRGFRLWRPGGPGRPPLAAAHDRKQTTDQKQTVLSQNRT